MAVTIAQVCRALVASVDALVNAATIFVWKKGRQMRKRVAWGLQHAWVHMIISNHSLEKAVRILSAYEKACFHATTCILYLIGYN